MKNKEAEAQIKEKGKGKKGLRKARRDKLLTGGELRSHIFQIRQIAGATSKSYFLI